MGQSFQYDAPNPHAMNLGRGHLLLILGAGFGIAVGVGNTIGTGILRTPGEVAGYLGSAWMFFVAWCLGGVYALLCSSSVTELGTILPRAGGWYVYARRAFGEHTGFVVGCCDWTVQSVSNAYLAAALGEFVGDLHPGLSQHVKWIGIAALGALALLNYIGLRAGSRTQEVTSLAKALAFIALIIACFALSPKHDAALLPAANAIGGKHSLFLGWILALQGVVITYDGWYAPIYFAEEDQNPARNLPRSMIGTALSCVGIFLLMNAALFKVLGMDHLAGSQFPAADASQLLFGNYGRQVILLISAVSVIGTMNATLLYTPRILFGMARDQLLPPGIMFVNQGGTPALALFLCTLASIALVATGTFDTLIAIGSVLFVAVYVSGFASLLVLRKREPLLTRPYKVWWYPWSTIGVLLASTAFLGAAIIGDLRHSLFTLILVLLSYLASILMVRNRMRSNVDT